MEFKHAIACDLHCLGLEENQRRVDNATLEEERLRGLGKAVVDGKMRCWGPSQPDPFTGIEKCRIGMLCMTEGITEEEQATIARILGLPSQIEQAAAQQSE